MEGFKSHDVENSLRWRQILKTIVSFSAVKFILKERLINISIYLSTISIILTLMINYKIAQEYLRVDGKTRALFGIKELLQFGYQYYIVGLGILSATMAIFGGTIKSNKKYFAILLSTIAIGLVFLKVWRIFV